MDELTKKSIDIRIRIIIEEYNFENRKKTHPDECPCNSLGPCHPIDELNCFFCYCPWYDSKILEGGCNIENPLGKGKWFYRIHSTSDRIWDCSECTYPHEEKTVRKVLQKLFEGRLNTK